MIRVVSHHYSVHVPGRYSKRDRQGRIFFLVRHPTLRPERIKNVAHKLSTTGEAVIHDRIHYGDGAQAISIAENGRGSREFDITGHDLVEPGLPGHLPIYADGAHSVHQERAGAVNELMRYVSKTGLRPEETEQLRRLLEQSADRFWGRE